MRIGKRLHCLLHGHRYYGYSIPTVDGSGTMDLPQICIHCGKRRELRTRSFLGQWFGMLPGSQKEGERHG